MSSELESDKLTTHTEFGYIKTDGNTETVAFNLESRVHKGWGKHIGSFLFDGQKGEESSDETKNKFFIELEYDYEFTERFAFDYLLGYKQDKFSGYAHQFYTGPGVKYKAIISEKHNLSLDGNLLYEKDDKNPIEHDISGDIIEYPNPDNIAVNTITPRVKHSYAAVRVAFAYDWQITDSLKFTQEASYRVEAKETDNYFVFSKTAFATKISDIFSAGISYKIDYINIPAEGKESKDTTLTANLIIDY